MCKAYFCFFKFSTVRKIAIALISIFIPLLFKAQIAIDPTFVQANNLRSDTIDVLHYNVLLNITDFTSDTIRGGTTIRYTARVNNVTTLSLDLLHMVIDSVTTLGNKLATAYTDTLLIITLPATINIGDTSETTVWYHGKPQTDPSGWGGFYFSGNSYAYNYGVGFQTSPVSFGGERGIWIKQFRPILLRSM